jgi:hypothetical protein
MAEIERIAAGFQMVIPGCERRALPRASSQANWSGQALLGFHAEPSLREKFACRAAAALTAKRGQKAPPRSGLFRA